MADDEAKKALVERVEALVSTEHANGFDGKNMN
jgi:hypothetical protein